MGPNTPPSSPVSAHRCRQPQVSKPTFDYEWEGPWRIVSVPRSEIESDTSPWHQERSHAEVRIVGKYRDDYEVAIDPIYVLALRYKGCQMNLEYNPVEPGEGQKAIHGINYANQKARNQWLHHAANIVCSDQGPEVEQAFYELARRHGIRGMLIRAILEHDIMAPPAETLSLHELGCTLRAMEADSNVQNNLPAEDETQSEVVQASTTTSDDPSFNSDRQQVLEDLEEAVKRSLHDNEFGSMFGDSCIIEKQRVEPIEDCLSDEYETGMIRQWSRGTESDEQLPDDEDEGSTTFGGFEIIGVKCKAAGNGLQWWYQTKVKDMTLSVDGDVRLDSPFGRAKVTPLSNGYQYVAYFPLWVRCEVVPEVWKKPLWEAIGPRFWSLTAPGSDAQWDGRANLYMSGELSKHLCQERHCKICQGRY